MGDCAIEYFAGLKPKMYSFLVDGSSEHKTTKGVNKMLLLTEDMMNTRMFY